MVVLVKILQRNRINRIFIYIYIYRYIDRDRDRKRFIKRNSQMTQW